MFTGCQLGFVSYVAHFSPGDLLLGSGWIGMFVKVSAIVHVFFPSVEVMAMLLVGSFGPWIVVAALWWKQVPDIAVWMLLVPGAALVFVANSFTVSFSTALKEIGWDDEKREDLAARLDVTREDIEAAEKGFNGRPWCRFMKSGSLAKEVEWSIWLHLRNAEPVSMAALLLGVGCFAGSRRRLRGIWDRHGSDVDSSRKVQSIESFCEVISAWAHEGTSYVSFRDDEANKSKGVLRQRVQTQGNSFFHATVMVLFYARCRREVEPEVVDMTGFVLKKFEGTEIIVTLIFQKSFPSKVMLARFGAVKDVAIDRITKESLMSTGPLLVSQFRVSSDFRNPEISSHSVGFWRWLKSRLSIWLGRHAMVLVGVRLEGSEVCFLLQNWWQQKQFVELTADYLKASGAAIHSFDSREEYPTRRPSSVTEASDFGDRCCESGEAL
jgi:hypothetical protein